MFVTRFYYYEGHEDNEGNRQSDRNIRHEATTVISSGLHGKNK
jgi:hypothetical protein